MALEFRRAVGAHRDLKELEYISALQQTQKGELRADGSIRDLDISMFLSSRFNVNVTTEEVRDKILPGLAGTKDSAKDCGRVTSRDSFNENGQENAKKEEEYNVPKEHLDRRSTLQEDDQGDEGMIDLTELVAVLLMPALVNIASSDNRSGKKTKELHDASEDEEDISSVFEQMLGILLRDIGHDKKSPNEGRAAADADNHSENLDFCKYHDLAEQTSKSQKEKHSVVVTMSEVETPMIVDPSVQKERSSKTKTVQSYPEITPALLKKILRTYDEDELADNADLIQEMMDVVTKAFGGDGTAPVRLSPEVFTHALTSDIIDLLHPSDENKVTTNYKDVMEAGDGYEKEHEPWYVFLHPRFSTAHIDFAASNYSSKYIVVFLWTSFLLFIAIDTISGAWFWNLYDSITQICSTDTFGCYLGKSLVSWILKFALFISFGFLIIGLGGLGNGLGIISSQKISMRRIAAVCGSIVVIGLTGFTVWDLFEISKIGNYYNDTETNGTIDEREYEDGYYDTENLNTTKAGYYYQTMTVMLPLIAVLILQFWAITGLGGRLKTAVNSTKHSEAAMKQSAAGKTNMLIHNALKIHNSDVVIGDDDTGGETSLGSAILKFSMLHDQCETAGGFLWCWKRYFSGELSNIDGVRVSGRILALNVAQLLTAIYIFIVGIAWVIRIGLEWDYLQQDVTVEFLGPLLESTASVDVVSVLNELLEVHNSEELQNFIRDEASVDIATLLGSLDEKAFKVYSRMNDVANAYIPQERYMVTFPLIIFVITSSFYSASLFFTYFPSVCSTILKFRSGHLPFFNDKDMMKTYRTSINTGTALLGTMFWAGIFGPVIFGIVPAFVSFLFFWQVTRPFMLKLLATISATAITLSFKEILAVVFVKKEYFGFYRRNVNKVNIYSLAIESLQIGLGVLTAAVRTVQILAISVLFVSRIDTPLLADGVAAGPLGDKYPMNFRKELLVQESHRHPWVDVLGKIYLMKLRYHSTFVSNAGYAYRLIFTIILMPWLRKYRLMARPSLCGKSQDVVESKSLTEKVKGKLMIPYGKESVKEKTRFQLD